MYGVVCNLTVGRESQYTHSQTPPPKNPDYDTTEKEVNLSAGSNTERHV